MRNAKWKNRLRLERVFALFIYFSSWLIPVLCVLVFVVNSAQTAASDCCSWCRSALTRASAGEDPGDVVCCARLGRWCTAPLYPGRVQSLSHSDHWHVGPVRDHTERHLVSTTTKCCWCHSTPRPAGDTWSSCKWGDFGGCLWACCAAETNVQCCSDISEVREGLHICLGKFLL